MGGGWKRRCIVRLPTKNQVLRTHCDVNSGKSGISNEVGRCQEGSSSFFCLLESFSLAARRTHAHAQQRAFARAIFLPSSIAFVSTLLAQTRVACIIWCCLPTISSVRVDHDDLCELPS